jgi:GT2 family glycosyltransferase
MDAIPYAPGLRGDTRLLPVTGSNGWLCTARNRGIAEAKGQWVAMTDDDRLPDPDWLNRHLNFLAAHPELDAAAGAIVLVTDSVISRYVDWSAAMAHGRLRDGTVTYLVTANAVYHRKLLQQLGGFDTAFKWPGGEDADLSRRALDEGAVLGVNPDAVVKHLHRESLHGTYKMFWHHGLGAGATMMLRGAGRRPTFTRMLQSRIYPRFRLALRNEPLGRAIAYFCLECLRAVAFRRGWTAAERVMRKGSTSANG